MNTSETPTLPAHFDIDAAVVRQLGADLVTDEVTAMMELVKNSYDADADWCKIEISSRGILGEVQEATLPGYIIVEDGGFGMTDIDIRTKWLVISMSDKRAMKSNNEKTPKGRTPLGDKGLGRLSTQRLGYQLELISGKKESSVWHHAAFDWRSFVSGVSLSNVPITLNKSKKPVTQQGTRLIIRSLVNPSVWEKTGIERFRGQLSQLIFPYKEKRPFSVYLNINGQKQDLDEINESLRQQAIGHYTFEFDGETLTVSGEVRLSKLRGQNPEAQEEFTRLLSPDNGKDFFSYLTDTKSNRRHFLSNVNYLPSPWFLGFSRKFSFEKDFPKKIAYVLNQPKSDSSISPQENIGVQLLEGEDKPLRQFANPGPFLSQINEYDLRNQEGSVNSIFKDTQAYKNTITSQIGIRVFRDGFGIKPYGFDGYDWLNLGGSQTSGGSFYGLRPNNVIGYVSISMEKNSQLEELTSREGFTETPYSRNFFMLMQQGIREVNDVVERTRRSFVEYRRIRAEQQGGLKSVGDTTQLMRQVAKQARQHTERNQQTVTRFKDTSNQVEKVVKQLQAEQVKADPVVQQVLQQIQHLLSETGQLFEQVNKILAEAQKWDAGASLLDARVEDLEGQLTQFTELAGLGLTAEALSHELYTLLDRINAQTEMVSRQLRAQQSSAPPLIHTYLEYVKSFSRDLRNQLTYLAPSLRFNREKREIIQIGHFCQDISKFFSSRLASAGITVSINILNDFTISGNRGKLTQIFDNILLNSDYWLRNRLENDTSFEPQIYLEIEDPVVRLSDNGYGISPALEDRVFQPFVTAKPKEVGRGLGLFIVQQLLESMNCDISLLQQRNVNNRRYIFQLNLQSITVQ